MSARQHYLSLNLNRYHEANVKTGWISVGFSLVSCSLLFGQATPERIVRCTGNPSCSHVFKDGDYIQMITTSNVSISISVGGWGRYLFLKANIANVSLTPVDIVPSLFSVVEADPKVKSLKYLSAEEIQHSIGNRLALANALTSMGGALQRKQQTTETSSTDNVTVISSDGGVATGTINGQATSTTTGPDEEAQARARAQMANNSTIAAGNIQRVSSTSLRSNTIPAGQSTLGLVFFEHADKKNRHLTARLPIGGFIYEFNFGR